MSALDSGDADLTKDLDATVRARRELGEEYDTALVDSFLEKVGHRIDDTVDRRVRRQLAERQMEVARDTRRPGGAGSWAERFGFALVSLVLAVPLTAISGALAGVTGVVAGWLGIVGVNVVQSARFGPHRGAGRTGPRPARDDD